MKNVLSFLFLLQLTTMSAFAQTSENSVDCIILEDENSIICKYNHERLETDKEITIQWIDPNNEISRERTMTVPAGHASIYDYRYKEGRDKGEWTFKVIDNSQEYSTNFTIE